MTQTHRTSDGWQGCPGDDGMMVRARNRIEVIGEWGQSLLETALLLPILLLLVFNAINFGYFFFVAVNLAAAPRMGVQYSIVGAATPSQLELPPAGPPSSNTSVSYLTYQDIKGVLPGWANARVQVCSTTLGLSGTGSSQKANCAQYGSGTETFTPASDPEAPFFVLHRVDVVYEVDPLIPPFELPTPGGSIPLSLVPQLRFHRQVSMRAMQ
jgi:hypothetical protein